MNYSNHYYHYGLLPFSARRLTRWFQAGKNIRNVSFWLAVFNATASMLLTYHPKDYQGMQILTNRVVRVICQQCHSAIVWCYKRAVVRKDVVVQFDREGTSIVYGLTVVTTLDVLVRCTVGPLYGIAAGRQDWFMVTGGVGAIIFSSWTLDAEDTTAFFQPLRLAFGNGGFLQLIVGDCNLAANVEYVSSIRLVGLVRDPLDIKFTVTLRELDVDVDDERLRLCPISLTLIILMM